MPDETGLRLLRPPRPFTLHTSRQIMRMMGRSDERWRKYLFLLKSSHDEHAGKLPLAERCFSVTLDGKFEGGERSRLLFSRRIAERWPSGLRRRFAKPLYGQKLYPGFESLPLRQTSFLPRLTCRV